MIRFSCPTCNAVLQSPGTTAGDKVACPKCGQRLLVPNPVKLAASNKTVLGSLLPDSAGGTGTSAAPVPAPRADALRSSVASDDAGLHWSSRPSPVEAQERPRNAGKWWRPASPSFLVLSLLLFPLPWIEIRCSGGDMSGKVLVSQSGLQSIYGGGTLHPALETQRIYQEQGNREAKAQAANGFEPVRTKAKGGIIGIVDKAKDGGLFDSVAPFMLVYPFLLLAAVFFGFFLRPSLLRTVLIATPVGLAFLLLLLQVLIGFPLERRMNNVMMEMVGAAARDTYGRDSRSGAVAALAFDVSYTAWFWLGLFSDLAALLTLTLEWFVIGSSYRHQKPRT